MLNAFPIRVFPRRTKATPDDENVRIGFPSICDYDLSGQDIHISVTFTYDLEKAKRMADAWSQIGNVSIGGPGTGMRGEDFMPGMYLEKGYVITSRGCPNHCWFCSVPKREGNIRELPITFGNNILDDNLLACSNEHIKKVFDMLRIQPYGRPALTGGLEAARLKEWHVASMKEFHPQKVYFANDTPNDLDPLIEAGKLWKHYEMPEAYCYVLIGYSGDTFDKATTRLNQTINAGFMPMAMLYRDESGKRPPDWMRFQREWARPAIIRAKMR